MNVPDLIYGEPLLLAALAAGMVVLVHYQRGLTYREVVVLEYLKARLFDALDAKATKHGRPLAREAHAGDFVTTIDATPREIVNRTRPPFQPNLTSTAKFRILGVDETRSDSSADGTSGPVNGDVEWAHSQWASHYEHEGDAMQTHLVLFTDGTETAVYAHVEAPPTDPERHTEGEQLHGDAHERFADAYREGA